MRKRGLFLWCGFEHSTPLIITEGLMNQPVKNHGISEAATLGALNAAKRFFALPTDTKKKVCCDHISHSSFLPDNVGEARHT